MSELNDLLLQRFPHANTGRLAPILDDDQPDDYQALVKGQGKFPAVAMKNGVLWFFDKASRPKRGDTDEPMKAKAPPGIRRLLLDTADTSQLLIVEGEGDAFAALSVGFQGVCVGGGVQALTSTKPGPSEVREQVVKGKDCWVLFDDDDAGEQGAVKVAKALLESGAKRVAIVHPAQDWPEGGDLEDWLAEFDTPEAALAALQQLLASAGWLQREEVEKAEDADDRVRFVQSTTIPLHGSDTPALLVTVFDEEKNATHLAVLIPDDAVAENDSVMHDAPSLGRGWALLEKWEHEGRTYMPDIGGDLLKDVKARRLILPAPPAEAYGTSEQLWHDVRAYIQRWLALKDPRDYDLLVAYVFMTYRLFDAAFPYVPYLRFYGPPGTGKGRALAVMKHVMCRALDVQPTSSNIHRVVEFFGGITLVFDEFHLERGSTAESQERMIDTLNLGNDASKGLVRMEKIGNRMVPKTFDLFGPKCFAGYGHDEHEALARRTVSVNMADVEVPKPMDLFALPPRFYSEAYELRRRLLTWRGAKLALGLPDPEGVRACKLHEIAGREVGQAVWPLLEMVPHTMKEEEKNVLDAALRRKEETQESRDVASEAYLLHAFVEVIEHGGAIDCGKGVVFVGTIDVLDRVSDAKTISAHTIARELKKLGLRPMKYTAKNRHQRRGFAVKLDNPSAQALFARYGVDLPTSLPTQPGAAL